MVLDAVFLGMNDAGKEVYEWLNRREDIEIKALLTEKEQLGLIKDLEPEIVISSGFEHKVPEDIIEVPERGIINLHPSYLPYNKGAHPYVWPIIEGTPAGVSIHKMNQHRDEGPILAKRKVNVRLEDTAKDLYERLEQEQAQLFKDTWTKIKNNELEEENQDPSDGTLHYRKDFDEASRLDPTQTVQIGNFLDRLRGLTYPPHNTVYFERDGKRYYIEIDIEVKDVQRD